ncbi:MAG: NADP-specific glutamate dehydrogenase [Flavobacteriales bacterium]|nr:NADP-specific glutamate dehydrogenase [Flavobacteriales bacterium]MBO72081.1 NADP-specific glutamate dehydrogenase [Flavobacteriales bacterium]|tara:strand:- start:155 stop:1504 length:1350 start_codon:yes stop_codon:yes gene_type:complete
MVNKFDEQIQAFMRKTELRNSNEPEFIQAVHEVAETVIPFMTKNKSYKKANILERLVEPERVVMFRVPWFTDKGEYMVNRGYRVEMNSAIGPYKGGLRFHPSVNLSILKFLAFEQVFKNSLTTLPLGGGKGGSDFNPKGRSDREILCFCQSFMTELSRHIGSNTDVPAGDIGVGSREIGYLFGQYKRIQNEFTGVLTGKGLSYGGSLIRPEATGYGAVYFAHQMLLKNKMDFQGLSVAISGSGNVAQFVCEKVIELGGVPVSMSDSSGFIYDKNGIDTEKLKFIKKLKNIKRGRIKEYAAHYGCEYFKDKKPWGIKSDVAFPCATQNELDEESAKELVKNGIKCVTEGANMPTTPQAIEVFHKNNVLFSPGKASNAGGVATSGLEMSQNSLRISWTREEVDSRLKDIMIGIHNTCVEFGKDGKQINYVKGANIGGFIKVADAMIAQGHV